jgi:hypothetical protein
MKYFTLQEFEKAVDVITNQIIFVNALGQWEYHPEREDFLYRYYYAKYILKAEFEENYDLETDIFSLGFFENIEKEFDKLNLDEKMEIDGNPDFSALVAAVYNKVSYLKDLSLQKSVYSITDVYLGTLLDKLNTWIEDKGITKAMEVLAKAGEQLEKDSEDNGNKNIRKSKQKAK